MEDTFKAGDVVQLRCGGPPMVIRRWKTPAVEFPGVTNLNPATAAWECSWQVQGALRRELFEAAELRLVADP